MSYNYSW